MPIPKFRVKEPLSLIASILLILVGTISLALGGIPIGKIHPVIVNSQNDFIPWLLITAFFILGGLVGAASCLERTD